MMPRHAHAVYRGRIHRPPPLSQRVFVLSAAILALGVVVGAIGFLGTPVPDAVRNVSGWLDPGETSQPASPAPVVPARLPVGIVPAVQAPGIVTTVGLAEPSPTDDCSLLIGGAKNICERAEKEEKGGGNDTGLCAPMAGPAHDICEQTQREKRGGNSGLRDVYNGKGEEPPFSGPVETMLKWAVWGALTCCVAGFIIIGARMGISHKRGEGGGHMGSMAIVGFACTLIMAAYSIVDKLTGVST